jgi:tRNA dimethylallyltransferase
VASPLAVIVGPTGSGKSALALRIASELGGEIVNCDSLQLYRGFDIGTAKTPGPDRAGIPHHLFDVLTPRIGYSAGEYGRAARPVVSEIAGRGRLPIVVGGTGFYLRALLDGLPELPARDPDLRRKLLQREERQSGVLHRLLRRLDPQSAALIHPHDVQKLVRALEVRVLTQRERPATDRAAPLTGFRVSKIGLDPARAELADRLNRRTRAMFDRGLIDEVRALLAGGLTGEEKPFESLGYKQALAVIRGTFDREQAIVLTQNETRQYAKRQRTWFRRDSEICWLTGFGESPEIGASAIKLLQLTQGE